MSENRVVTATYREIAYRFGIGIEGARIKTKRRAAKGLWRIIPGNHPQDIIRVEIPEEEWNSPQRSLAHTERLIEAEKGRAEAERDAAIAQAALANAEARLTAMQEQHLAELKELRDRMKAEADKAQSELAEWKAHPWWRRLVS
jgi:hypothetical protein